MAKRRRSNLATAAVLMRERAAGPVEPVAFRRQLVADLCKLLGSQLPAGREISDAAESEPTTSLTQPSLAPRLQQTLELLLAGDSEKQIARKLSISPHTVHAYVKSLYRTFNVSSRGELLARWVKR